MKLLAELLAFGQAGSRKAQAYAIGGTAVLGGTQVGLGQTQTYVFAALTGVYILAVGLHDMARVKES